MDIKSKVKTLDEYDDIRKNIGFHFTSRTNIESILDEGLRAQLGDNSSGSLGKEAIEKTFLSYGLGGVLQLYNRLLNASVEMKLSGLRNSKTHSPFIPESANIKLNEQKLSIIEGFELVRQYMTDNVYFICDVPETQYSKQNELSESDIKEINLRLRKLKLEDSDKTIIEKISELDHEIEKLIEQNVGKETKELIEKVEQRRCLSIEIRNQTLKLLNEKRGELINEYDNPIIERLEYNEDKIKWYDQLKTPHNTHTRIIEDQDGIHGIRIMPQIMNLYSNDGKNVSTGVEFVRDAYNRIGLDDKIKISEDCILLDKFIKYVEMVRKYEEQGKLKYEPEKTVENGKNIKKIPERYVMDLSDYSQYPGLEEFEKDVREYYQMASPKVKLSIEKTYNTGFPIDINSMNQNEKNNAIVQWSEGNRGLRSFLYLCDKNGIETRACCGGHSKEEQVDDSGMNAYVAINFDRNGNENLINLLSVIEDIENCQIIFVSSTDNEPFCNIVSLQEYTKDEELFFKISEKLEFIIQNPDMVLHNNKYEKYKNFVDFFSSDYIKDDEFEIRVVPSAKEEKSTANNKDNIKLLQNKNAPFVKPQGNKEAEKFIETCDYEDIELRALFGSESPHVAINLTRENEKIAKLLSQIEDDKNIDIAFIKVKDGDAFCNIYSKNETNIFERMNEALEKIDKNIDITNPSYEKYKAYIQFFSSNALENMSLQMYMNQPNKLKNIKYHRNDILKNMLVDDTLQTEVDLETKKAIREMEKNNQQFEK